MIKGRLAIPLVGCLLTTPGLRATEASPADALVAMADQAWAERDQEGRTLASIALWQQALKADPTRKELWIRLTAAMGRAVRRAETPAEAKRWAERAREAGRQAVLENPSNPEAYAYAAESLGQWAKTHKGLGALKRVKEAVKQLDKALALKPDYAYAHMLLSSFYGRSPGFISIGDKRKALTHAEAAVRYAPTYAINRLTLAHALLDLQRRDEAIAQLKTILTLTPPADAIPETRADQDTARHMLTELEEPCATTSSPDGACRAQ